MAKRYIDPRPQYFDDSGDPLAFGKVYIYEQGSATAKDLFYDAEESIAAPNPVILTGSGRLGNTFFSGTARAKLTDKDEVQYWDIDNIASSEIEGAFATWDSVTTYDVGDIVTGSNGNFYLSITNSNTGNDPISDAVNWEQIDLIGFWNTNITYAVGDIVIASDNNLYKAKASQISNDPSLDIQFTNWQPAFNQFSPQADDASLASGTHTFDAGNFDMQQLTATGDITIAFTGFPTGMVDAFIVDAINWGAHTITLPAAIETDGGTAPVFTAAGTDRLLVISDKDGVVGLSFINRDLK